MNSTQKFPPSLKQARSSGGYIVKPFCPQCKVEAVECPTAHVMLCPKCGKQVRK